LQQILIATGRLHGLNGGSKVAAHLVVKKQIVSPALFRGWGNTAQLLARNTLKQQSFSYHL
jgi:hypothetical protein